MSNLQKIQAALASRELDAVLLVSPENRQYATGLRTSSGYVLIHRGGGHFITDFRYIEAAKTLSDFSVSMSTQSEPVSVQLNKIIAKANIEKLAVEESHLTVSQFRHFCEILSVQPVFENGMMAELRQVKSQEEIDKLKAAVKIGDDAFAKVLPLIKPGMTENELAAELTYQMLLLGAEGMSFDPIVVSGARSSMPHGTPSDKKLMHGDFVTMDFGCIKYGYCSDMTRTIALGEITREMQTVYETVSRAQLAAIDRACENIPACDVDRAAREIIEQAGYGEAFGHSTGHGVGLQVHEGPNASPRSNELLKAGNIISAEPGIYLDGKFGVRIEDLILITPDGCEVLSHAPKELMIL